MTDTKNKSWALSSYFDNKKNLFLEIRCINNKFKGWVHLDYVDLIVQPKDVNPANESPIKEKSVWCTQYFNNLSGKYFPIDSSNYRIGILQIPLRNRCTSITKCLPIIDNQYKSDRLIPSKNTENIYLKFVFIDNNKNKFSIMTTPIKRLNIKKYMK